MPAALGVELAQVDDCGGDARQLAAVEHHVGALAQLLRHLRQRPRVGLARHVGARLHDRTCHRRERVEVIGQARDAQPERRGIFAAGGAKAPRTILQQHRHRPGQQRLQSRALAVGQVVEGIGQ